VIIFYKFHFIKIECLEWPTLVFQGGLAVLFFMNKSKHRPEENISADF